MAEGGQQGANYFGEENLERLKKVSVLEITNLSFITLSLLTSTFDLINILYSKLLIILKVTMKFSFLKYNVLLDNRPDTPGA